MARNGVAEWSTNPDDNKDISGINIDEGCPPSGINNAIRQIMASVKNDMMPLTDATPKGFIGMWSGTFATIPAGWALCNGQNGTPDLRDRFIVGAGSTYAVGATGGATTHAHTIGVENTTLAEWQMPSHNHGTYVQGVDTNANRVTTQGYGAAGWWDTTYAGGSGAHGHNGYSAAASNNPLYYALAFIMKL